MSVPRNVEIFGFIVGMYVLISFVSHGNLFRTYHVHNRVVVLTDATSKMGRQLAMEYAGMKARLFVIVENHEILTNLTRDCLKAGAEEVTGAVGDINNAHFRSKLAATVEIHYDKIHYLILNHDFLTLPTNKSTWNDPSNLRGVIQSYMYNSVDVFIKLLPLMRRQRGGYVAAVSALPGRVSLPYTAALSAAKAALHAYFASLRQQLKMENRNFMSVTSLTVAYVKQVDDRTEVGSWGWIFDIGRVPAENAAWWTALLIGGRKKEVTYPFAAQCQAMLYSWLPDFYENPKNYLSYIY